MAYTTKPSPLIKAYITKLKYPTGKKDYHLAVALGIQPVTFSLISTRMDEATGQQIYKLAKELGVDAGEFLKECIKLRQQEPQN